MRFALLFLSVAALAGQTLRVATVPAAAGEETRVAVWLESPPGKEPLALQMEIDIPSRALSVQGPPAAGEAAMAAGKSASCNGRWKKAPQTYNYVCILAGGKNAIQNGLVLVIKARIPSDVKPGNYPIKVDHAQAVDANVKSIQLKPAEASLAVSRK